MIASTHQSGSHWLKYMLSLALAEKYDLKKPETIRDEHIIGHPKNPPRHDQAPNIVHAHSIPTALMYSGLFKLPKYIVLVRDPRDALISHYNRYKNVEDYKGVDFDTFLKGDPWGKRFYNDLWSRMFFFNAWGKYLEKFPGQGILLKYEELNDLESLKKALNFVDPNTEYSDALIARAQEGASKDKMASKQIDLGDNTQIISEKRSVSRETYFTKENEAFLREACHAHLKYDFGYDLK